MNKKHFFAVLLALVVLTMALAGCGSEKPAETTAAPEVPTEPQPLGLAEWTMNATTWSSPNGATVNIVATPTWHAEGHSAVFSVRMEGDEVFSTPCEWNGTAYTASAELNAADGYCYYVVLTAEDGTGTEVGVNLPNAPTDESLINLEDALNSYCTVSVNASSFEEGKLTITEGTARIRMPRLTLDTGKIACQQAVLVMSYNGGEVALEKLTVPAADESGLCTVDLAGTTFSIPTGMEDGHQLSMRMDVMLTNGHTLTAAGGNWYYLDGNLLLAVG